MSLNRAVASYERYGFSNNWQFGCLLKIPFKLTTKKIIKVHRAFVGRTALVTQHKGPVMRKVLQCHDVIMNYRLWWATHLGSARYTCDINNGYTKCWLRGNVYRSTPDLVHVCTYRGLVCKRSSIEKYLINIYSILRCWALSFIQLHSRNPLIYYLIRH